MFKKKLCTVLLTLFLMTAAIGTTDAASVVSLGSWNLGDSFDLVYGTENSTKYTYDEMQNLYLNNYYNVQCTEMDIENSNLLYQQYSLEFDKINNNIINIKKLIDQNKDVVENQQQLADLIIQKAVLYVNKETSIFTYNNSSVYRNIQRTSQLSEFRDNLFKTKLIYEKSLVQKNMAEYARLQANSKEINKSKDMAFQSDIDLYNADYDYYISQQELHTQQVNTNMENLLSSCGMDTARAVTISVPVAPIRAIPIKKFIDAEKSFYLNDYKSMQMGERIRILDGKVSILKEYYKDSSNEIKLAVNEKKQAELEARRWLVQRKALLQNYYSDYKSKYYEVDIKEKKANALYQKYIILLNKYNYKLATELSLKEAEVNYKIATQEAWDSLCGYVEALGKIEKAISGNIE
ncbi:hypothetical protein [Ruminiclostridium papyrosolvens]|uniref:Outer membrane efflux protein n=1 Tax=Ruminiclostridium papyrosolvens C7 TaxID=1330534 RepID=U4R1S8_9FIRM|nr:hypothetical protein [Ruminiclostridium papyrosolvens]EPR12005.1 hypothetical protein L323_10305 [Ruminiclostridium papyrosolvens C7]